MAKLYPLLNHRSSLNQTNGETLYKVCIRLITITSKQVSEENITSPGLCAQAKMEILQEFMLKQAKTFYKSTENHTNPLITQLRKCQSADSRAYKRPKHMMCEKPP
ncbi:hypothetical protein PR048_014927 [Dryococelus australis]|uniref:Uncharacterized protein n=1 Tax=Dryococelus australis TaxID=614101 RepID=A0ABQ9HGD7_9NEOP|nr:hypothetical protein PR048_014927 [Dryococelus australis]